MVSKNGSIGDSFAEIEETVVQTIKALESRKGEIRLDPYDAHTMHKNLAEAYRGTLATSEELRRIERNNFEVRMKLFSALHALEWLISQQEQDTQVFGTQYVVLAKEGRPVRASDSNDPQDAA